MANRVTAVDSLNANRVVSERLPLAHETYSAGASGTALGEGCQPHVGERTKFRGAASRCAGEDP